MELSSLVFSIIFFLCPFSINYNLLRNKLESEIFKE